MAETPRVAIIGGGVTGLALAHRLLELGRERNRPAELTVYEASQRLGGSIETEERESFLLEKGADAFLSQKPAALALVKRLGLEQELLRTNEENRKSFVVRAGRLVEVPPGFYLTAPTNLSSFFKSPLLSWPGKLRAALELAVPVRANGADESIGSFVRRRFGCEMLERVAQPMLAGIYTGDPETLSLLATLPRFRELEKKHRSLIRGLRRETVLEASSAQGPRYSLFLSFKRGMHTLINGLLKAIPPQNLKTGQSVREAFRGPGSQWTLRFSDGSIQQAGAVVFCVPARRAAQILDSVDDRFRESLKNLSYESVATLNLAYRREAIAHALDGFGFVVPRLENLSLVACSFSSQKFEGRAPRGFALLRAFVGGAFGKKYFEKDDRELMNHVKKDLGALLGIRGEPYFSHLERYPDSMVQYAVGHLDWVAGIEKELQRFPGLYLCGASYRGVGIPDCIEQAERTAEKIYETLLFSQVR